MPEFTRVTPENAGKLLAHWGLALDGPDAMVPLPGGIANTTYCVNGAWVLAVLDRLDPEAARNLAGFLADIAGSSLPTPPVRLTEDGASSVAWQGHTVMLRAYWPAEVLSPLPDNLMGAAGALLAAIHATPPPSVFPVAGIGFPLDWRPHMGGAGEALLAAAIEAAEAGFDPAAYASLPRGLVHGDLFDDNILVRPDGSLGVIDWEFGCIDAFVIDIAMAVIGVCRTGASLPRPRLSDFLAGYEEHRPLLPPERTLLRPAVLFTAARVAFYRDYIARVLHPELGIEKDWREITAFMNELPDPLLP